MLSILLMCWGSWHKFYFSSALIVTNRNPHTLEELKYQARKVWMKEDNIFNISCYKVDLHENFSW